MEVNDNGSNVCGRRGPSLQRHATSKIRSSDDLSEFEPGIPREALPSIASVSHLYLTTKPPEEPAGTRIHIHGGDIESVEEVGGRDGTSVIVVDLFQHSRAAQIKSTSAEIARAVDVARKPGAFPSEIAFRVKHREQEMFSTPGTGESLAAIRRLGT